LFTAPPGLAFFDCGGVRLMLTLPEAPEFDHPGSILYFRVDDIQSANATLVKKGAVVESPPQKIASFPDHDLWLSFFRDSEGNPLCLMSEVRRE
jgi:methylmalonyl-CoA/ethylmalonyl-CoA epimerase